MRSWLLVLMIAFPFYFLTDSYGGLVETKPKKDPNLTEPRLCIDLEEFQKKIKDEGVPIPMKSCELYQDAWMHGYQEALDPKKVLFVHPGVEGVSQPNLACSRFRAEGNSSFDGKTLDCCLDAFLVGWWNFASKMSAAALKGEPLCGCFENYSSGKFHGQASCGCDSASAKPEFPGCYAMGYMLGGISCMPEAIFGPKASHPIGILISEFLGSKTAGHPAISINESIDSGKFEVITRGIIRNEKGATATGAD